MKETESVLSICFAVVIITMMLCISQCDRGNNKLRLELLKIEKGIKE